MCGGILTLQLWFFNYSERKEQQEKRQKEDRDRKMKFRTKIEKEVNELINDSTKTKRKYEPMDKICRSIV